MAASVTQGAIIPVGADISGLKTGLDQARAEVQRFGQQAAPGRAAGGQQAGAGGRGGPTGRQTGMGYSRAAQEGMALASGSGLGGIVGAATMAGAAFGAYSLHSNMTRGAFENQRAADNVGISANKYNDFAVSARKSGIAVEEMRTALDRLRQASLQAASGNQYQRGVFAAIGIDPRSLGGLAPDQLLEKVARGVQHLGREEQNAVAAAMFGREGGRMMPFLNRVAGGQDSGRGTGIASQMAAASSAQFNQDVSAKAQNAYGLTIMGARVALGLTNAEKTADEMMAEQRKVEIAIKADLAEKANPLIASMQTQAEWESARVNQIRIMRNEGVLAPGQNYAANRERAQWLEKSAHVEALGMHSGVMTPGQKLGMEMQRIAIARGYSDAEKGRMLLSAQNDYISAVQPIGTAPGAGTDTAAGFATVVGAQQQYAMRQNRINEVNGLGGSIFGGAWGALRGAAQGQLGWERGAVDFFGVGK